MKRVVRTAARSGVALGIVGAAVTMAATPALAASGSLTVTPSGTVTSNGVISIAGHYDNRSSVNSTTMKITISRPDGSSYALWSGSARGLSTGSTPTQSFDTGNAPWGGEAINGDYTVNFTVGSAAATPVDVTLRVPPAPVSGFSGSPSGSVVHFSWAANSEPDLAGYDIVDVSNGRRDLTPGGIDTSACSGGSCQIDIDFGSSAAGTSRQFVIDALRYTGPSHSSALASSDSAPTSVAFATPSTATPGGSSGGTSGGGTAGGGTTSGGSTGGGGGATGGATSGGRVSGGSSGSSGGIAARHASAALRAYLPSVSAAAAPNLPSVVTEIKPLPQGTYQPTLAYPDQVLSQAVHHRASGPMTTVSTEIGRVLDVQALWKSLAGAVVVLLVAAHLRAWLSDAEALD